VAGWLEVDKRVPYVSSPFGPLRRIYPTVKVGVDGFGVNPMAKISAKSLPIFEDLGDIGVPCHKSQAPVLVVEDRLSGPERGVCGIRVVQERRIVRVESHGSSLKPVKPMR
jgi:hypothetical protein